MGESIALVEFSKYGQRVWSKSFEYAHIEVGLKLWNPHSFSQRFAAALLASGGGRLPHRVPQELDRRFHVSPSTWWTDSDAMPKDTSHKFLTQPAPEWG